MDRGTSLPSMLDEKVIHTAVTDCSLAPGCDSRLQAADSRLQAADSRLQAADSWAGSCSSSACVVASSPTSPGLPLRDADGDPPRQVQTAPWRRQDQAGG